MQTDTEMFRVSVQSDDVLRLQMRAKNLQKSGKVLMGYGILCSGSFLTHSVEVKVMLMGTVKQRASVELCR